MIISTLDTWKHMQENDYFENHVLYDMENIDIPEHIVCDDIKDKVVVEIGGGYGRETFSIAMLAKTVYIIEVSKTIIDKAHSFLTKNGVHNVEYVLAEEYDKKIPDGIDYVYENLVFQHLTHGQTEAYIDIMHSKLKVGGKALFQFRLGEGAAYPNNSEPTVLYSESMVYAFMHMFTIEKEERVSDDHLWITGVKK